MPTIADSLAQMDASRERWSRVGEHWPRGPVSERAAQPVALATLVPLLRLGEAAEPDDGALRRRLLRRLYFSHHARWPEGRRRGLRLDALIAGGLPAEVPLARSLRAEGLDGATLDALHAAGYLLPAAAGAVPVDTGAVLAGMDTAFSGGSHLALAAEYATGAPVEGTAGWAGDLACWLLEWNRRRAAAAAAGAPWTDAEAQAQLAAVQGERAPLELLLGAMDGRVLGAHLEASVTDTVESAPAVADTLEAYFGAAAPAGHPHVSGRFFAFVSAARPVIPHAGEGSGTTLDADAPAAIRAHVRAVAAFFVFHGWRDALFGAAVGAPPVRTPPTVETAAAEVEAQGAALDAVVAAFVALLQAGLAGATLPAWPRAT